MGVQITIRDFSKKVRDELAVRAARERNSMQEFFKGELERLTARPSIQEWVERVRARKWATGRRIPGWTILRHRDADRR